MAYRTCARHVASFLLAFALCATAEAADKLPAWAPQPKPHIIEDRLRTEVMVLGAGLNTDLRIDESLTVRGTELNAEDDLGLDDSELLPQAEITLLPGERHLVRLSALATHRSARKLLEEGIVFDDQVYLRGERVDSRLDLTMVGMTYGYRLLVRARGELAATLGIQVAEVEANAVVRSRVIREAESGVAPLPLVGLEGRYDFSPRWSLEARAQYLTADIEEVDGAILDTRLAVTWRLNPHLLFGLGYRHFSIEVESRDAGTPGFVDLRIGGPLLFMRASL